jgi:hypothetical protein
MSILIYKITIRQLNAGGVRVIRDVLAFKFTFILRGPLVLGAPFTFFPEILLVGVKLLLAVFLTNALTAVGIILHIRRAKLRTL